MYDGELPMLHHRPNVICIDVILKEEPKTQVGKIV